MAGQIWWARSARDKERALEPRPDVQLTLDVTPGVDVHGNRVRREGRDRCWCGCKYWEHDRCIDCGGTEPQPEDDQ
jgi:hypothetical protein